MNPVDISKLSVIELKAMSYDEIQKMNFAERNLQILQQEISKRMQENKAA